MLTDAAFLRYHRPPWIQSSHNTVLNCEMLIYCTLHSLTNVGVLNFEFNNLIYFLANVYLEAHYITAYATPLMTTPPPKMISNVRCAGICATQAITVQS